MTRAERRRHSKAHILAVARRLFSSLGFERTSFRGIAAEAGVDPRLVLHYFGSKERLFHEAASPPPQEQEPGAAVTGGTVDGPPERVAEALLASMGAKLHGEHPATLAVLRSMLTHPDAADSLRAVLRRQQENLSAAVPAEDARLRIGLIGALALGVTVGRELLELDGVRDASPEEIVSLLRPCVHALTHGESEPIPRHSG